MRINLLSLNQVRCFSQLELSPGPGLNWLIGANGVGKTTILEAIHILSYGRSFRRGPRDSFVQRESSSATIFAQVVSEAGQQHKLGLERRASRWNGRINGEDISQLSELFAKCAACCFEPGSHELIGGGPEGRRAFLDWGVFHVEQSLLQVWRDYQRALKQRNFLLKNNSSDSLFPIWEQRMELASIDLNRMRLDYISRFKELLVVILSNMLPELGQASLNYDDGWKTNTALSQLLADSRLKDRVRGASSVGPHRADWMVSFERAPNREFLSRGQEKLVALSCVLAQANLFKQQRGESAIICFDDLSSELDESHQQLALEQILTLEAQVFISGVAAPKARASSESGAILFHVEPAQLRRQQLL